MDAAQLTALHAASTLLATAQTAALNDATDATTDEVAATTAAAANPAIQANVTAANAHATLARVAAIMANIEVEAATTAVNALMIKPLRERCNTGKNKRVWRQQFKSCTHRQGLSVDNWLCELRDLARKCEFETCCNRCDAEQMLDQSLFGLHDRQVQLKLFDIGPTITIDQAISTARTCETSKLLAEQLTTRASVQGINPKSTFQKQKSAKVTTAAAAAAKADAPNKPPGATCDKCGLEIRPQAIIAQQETRRAGNATLSGTSKPPVTQKPKWQTSTSIKCPPPKTTASQFQSKPEENQPQRYAHYQTPDQPSTPSNRPSTTANSKTYHSTPAYTPRPQPATTSSHSGLSKLKSTGKPTTDRPNLFSQPFTSWKT
ncbi:hypothetical protein DAPPUDRAFT_245786 [Daphnia pulex]|uniref:Uncharacterized protein n=1 Tax=Daphnia pulex TaxID=6669 RepID=E9GP24_DAPPU|nr:hypothetical protein DAPPUDRAFT_245786 [Daphnia pulex]|eukprot:EFX78758.1 hypothetical protein DAPPUDRAFT_245786 [Daphnia pulex]